MRPQSKRVHLLGGWWGWGSVFPVLLFFWRPRALHIRRLYVWYQFGLVHSVNILIPPKRRWNEICDFSFHFLFHPQKGQIWNRFGFLFHFLGNGIRNGTDFIPFRAISDDQNWFGTDFILIPNDKKWSKSIALMA